MKITSVEFVTSARDRTGFPRRVLPEIAFFGRSNVGKSSLINTLLHRKSVAKVSSTPGKTRGLNYFIVNDLFYLVDLPGYGYAKLSKAEHAAWDRMMREYLAPSERRRMGVLLVDFRHDPSPLDLSMKEILDRGGMSYVVAATKADKLSGNERARNLARLEQAFPTAEIFPFSSVTDLGRLKLLSRHLSFVAPATTREGLETETDEIAAPATNQRNTGPLADARR